MADQLDNVNCSTFLHTDVHTENCNTHHSSITILHLYALVRRYPLNRSYLPSIRYLSSYAFVLALTHPQTILRHKPLRLPCPCSPSLSPTSTPSSPTYITTITSRTTTQAAVHSPHSSNGLKPRSFSKFARAALVSYPVQFSWRL
jgi:hypothetical protein